MNKNVSLTYILATRNKASFIKLALEELSKHKQDDEELIIIDGNSTDDTKKCLNEFIIKVPKLIDILISEDDNGESHALNKGILQAKGELIKFIADDDIFCYHAIKQAKNIMLADSEIDITFGITFNVVLGYLNTMYTQDDSILRYNRYLKDKTCFSFTGLSLMVRKIFFAKVGLLSTISCAPDTEFTLRASFQKARIKMLPHPYTVRVENNQSNFNYKSRKKFALEGIRLHYKYGRLNFFTYSLLYFYMHLKYNFGMRYKPFINSAKEHKNEAIDISDFYNQLQLFIDSEYTKSL